MRLIHAFVASALLITCGSSAIAKRPDPEAKLAKVLKGRVAGEPVRCIQTYQVRSTRIIERTAIVYDAGSVIYVNRPDGAEQLGRDDILLSKPTGSQLCNVDSVRLIDQGSHMQNGFVGLRDFVPYRKVAR